MCALNEYNMTLEEKPTMNRLHDSLKIWSKLTSAQHFTNCKFILIFNKADIFQKKIETHPLSDVFNNYQEIVKAKESESELEKSYYYIEHLYKERFGAKRPYDCFRLNSTDTQDFEKVWDQVSVIILQLAKDIK